MSEAVWYYAIGDEEKGPVAAGEVLQMLASGTLDGDSLVWREGLPDWTTTSSISEFAGHAATATPKRGKSEETPLSPPVGTAVNSPPAEPAVADPPIAGAPVIRAQARQVSSRLMGAAHEFNTSLKMLAQPLLFFGLILILGSRGCDTIGQRYADRLKVRAELAKNQFQDEWDAQRLALEKEKDGLADDATAETRDAIDEKLRDLDKERREEQAKLTDGSWRYMNIAARDARANDMMWRFWRGLFFAFGAILFTGGLVASSFSSHGPERWISMGILAIVVFSLFVFGTAWG